MSTLSAEMRSRIRFPKTKDGFSTTGEIAESLGLSRTRTIAILKSLIAEGKVEISQIQRADMSGRLCKVPGYRLHKKATKKS